MYRFACIISNSIRQHGCVHCMEIFVHVFSSVVHGSYLTAVQNMYSCIKKNQCNNHICVVNIKKEKVFKIQYLTLHLTARTLFYVKNTLFK